MAHLLDKSHVLDRRTLARINTAILFGLVCTGLVACGLGASVYDFGRWLSLW